MPMGYAGEMIKTFQYYEADKKKIFRIIEIKIYVFEYKISSFHFFACGILHCQNVCVTRFQPGEHVNCYKFAKKSLNHQNQKVFASWRHGKAFE